MPLSAPPSLPNYLAEGLPKQDDEALREARKYIDELLAVSSVVVTRWHHAKNHCTDYKGVPVVCHPTLAGVSVTAPTSATR